MAYIQQNRVMRAFDVQPNPPSWGLDRIDQRTLPLNRSFTYSSTASSVRVYVIDSGIRTTHTTFGGRAIWGVNTTGDGIDTDCYGHGTHVAGTIGGAQYGVAKGVTLVAVKVLGCDGTGTSAGIIAGVDWVTGDHAEGVPAVANMSLGGMGSDSLLESKVRASIRDGVVYTIAAGNFGSDICNVTPARVIEAITVSATQSNDARAPYSNWSGCTDIYAPGSGIVSSWHTSDVATSTQDGTSMAAPHAAGAAALLLAAQPGLSTKDVENNFLSLAARNVVTNAGPSRKHLLFSNLTPAPPGMITLTRYFQSGDHWSATLFGGGAPSTMEGILAYVFTTQVAGTVQFYSCFNSASSTQDRFTSLDPACEGKTMSDRLGFVYTTPPAQLNRAIYRCKVIGRTDTFDSMAANCEGQTVDRLLFYALI